MAKYDIQGETPVSGADFYVTEIRFQREIDDKVYLYLQPTWLSDTAPKVWIIRPELSAISAPLEKACTPEADAMELLYEFYRRNPLPNPVEMYNFHYLLGNDPGTQCLYSTITMHP
jgi:hypothetical protein